MSGVAFVADLHLGAGSGRLEAQREAWLEAVAIANEEASALVIAGDVFHRARPTPDELDAFVDGLERLAVQTIAIVGNHDVSSMSEATALEVLMRGRDGMTATRHPQTFTRSDCTLAVLPWTPLRPSSSDLLSVARALYVSCDTELPCALVAHWSIGGALLPNGRRCDDVTRETMLPRHELETLGFDAIIAGHIHRAQSLGEGFVPIEYVGSLAAVDHSEADGEHGVLVWYPIEGAIERFEVSSGPRFVTLGLEDLHELDTVHEGAIVRVRYSATPAEARAVEPSVIRDALVGASEVAISPTIVREANVRGADLSGDVSPIEAVQAWLAEQAGVSPELADRMLDETQRYVDELGGSA